MTTTHILASASQAVYLDESEVESWADDRGFNEFTWFDIHDTQAAIMVDDTRCILAFRGTDSVHDWMTDVDVSQTWGPYTISAEFNSTKIQRRSRVHRGFNEALNHVWPEVEHVVALHSDKLLYVTGHSLGAALATLAIARFDYGTLYSFGSPRVGSKSFANEFNYRFSGNSCERKRAYRFVNNNDVVTRLPIRGYQHVGSLRHFTQSGKMWIEPSWRWVEWDRIWGRICRRVADGVKDHSVAEYVSLVAKHVG